VLHSNGFVHRDINAGNFLVNRSEKLFAIDLELCYQADLRKPEPPFTYGTAGYLSPEQGNLELPDFTDDIYSFGALMIKILTGISPIKLDVHNSELLLDFLMWHIGNHNIASMICRCFSDRNERPELKSIRHALEVHRAVLLTQTPEKQVPAGTFGAPNLISGSLKGIIINNLIPPESLWLTKTRENNRETVNEIRDFSLKPGFCDGISGMLHVISIADQLGYPFEYGQEIVLNNIAVFNSFFDSASPFSQPGLYYGSYGFAVTLLNLINAGWLQDNIQSINHIYTALKAPSAGLNLSTGIAGQGLCMLHFLDKPRFPALYDPLQEITKTLLDHQCRDGSWQIVKPGQPNPGLKLTGFSDGIAGIIYFLLELYQKFQSGEVGIAINRALNYLLKTRISSGGHLVWGLNNKNRATDPWLDCGYSGIALLFLKAYQILRRNEYREVAENILRIHPEHISSNYLSLGNGLCGLGEIYLEAYQILKEEEWKTRAGHILAFLDSIKRPQKNGGISWFDGNETVSSSDLVNGNAGILHFLLKYEHPGKVNFPFLIS
jgi:serine/threonine protein kinase